MATPTMSSYVLGIDIGTSTVKAVLVESEGGGVAQESSQPLGSQHAEVEGGEGGEVRGARERGVEQVWGCLEECMSSLDPCKLQRVCGVGVCGQMHGCTLWNQQLAGLSLTSLPVVLPPGSCTNLVTWQDGRCSPEFLSSLPTSAQSLPPSTGYGCATLAWLQQHRPSVLKKFDRAGTIMDLVVWCLCREEGRATPVLMSAQNAASWGYFDVKSSQWEKDM